MRKNSKIIDATVNDVNVVTEEKEMSNKMSEVNVYEVVFENLLTNNKSTVIAALFNVINKNTDHTDPYSVRVWKKKVNDEYSLVGINATINNVPMVGTTRIETSCYDMFNITDIDNMEVKENEKDFATIIGNLFINIR